MVEESDSPGSDFLAERRQRRATETGEAALLRRAEAAEATVKTLESHVVSLQARLQEAEEERRRAAALLEAERSHASERESELRRVKQREYAEQQLRVEAEGRLSGLDRSAQRTGAEDGGPDELSELSARIDGLQRQLAEAEHAAGAERVALRRAEEDLATRVAGLERRAEELQRNLLAERTARERSERELAGIREGHRRMEGLLGEIRTLIARLGAVIGSLRRQPDVSPPPPPTPAVTVAPAGRSAAQERAEEMAEALAAAVERLRARALSAPPLPAEAAEPDAVPAEPAEAAEPVAVPAVPAAPAEAAQPDAVPAVADAPAPDAVRPSEPSAAGGEPSVPPAPRAEQSPAAGAGTAVPAPRAPEPPASQGPADGLSDRATAAAGEAVQSPALPLPAPAADVPPQAPKRPANKHSQSLIARIRNRRKERRGR